MNQYRVLDLFSAAAGGWSLGLHRAGFKTVAAAEKIAWRRALYAQNNPGVHLYDDVRHVTAAGLRRDLGFLPDIVVGSPPCQDISGANARGRGIEGDESSLYFEALRILGEVRGRWGAFENSDRVRNRGFDEIGARLDALGYAHWPLVVPAALLGANHERPRSWIIACDLDQLGRPRQTSHPDRWDERIESRWGSRAGGAGSPFDCDDDPSVGACIEQGIPQAESVNVAAAQRGTTGDVITVDEPTADVGRASTRAGGPRTTRSYPRKMGRRSRDRESLPELWPGWNGGFVRGLRVDDGLSSAVAGLRIAVGGPRGTSGARLITEAFGDAVIPQIPEVIGRAIMKVEAVFNG